MSPVLPFAALLALAAVPTFSAAGDGPREAASPAAVQSREQGIAPEAVGRERSGMGSRPTAPHASRSRAPRHLDPLPPVLLRIRWCESRDDYQAENRHSSASGAFQVLNGTWANYDGYARAKYAPRHVQDRQALKLFRKSGTRPWNASRRCWS